MLDEDLEVVRDQSGYPSVDGSLLRDRPGSDATLGE
jgi:hypothetical protein